MEDHILFAQTMIRKRLKSMSKLIPNQIDEHDIVLTKIFKKKEKKKRKLQDRDK
jgi:hypothetical protein